MNGIYRFSSGLRLAYKCNPSVRSVSIGVMTGVGSGNEIRANNGISHFIEHMYFKGTKDKSAFEIVEYVDGIGAQINAFTSKQTTCFYTLSIDSQADNCARILSEILFESTFDESEMEREKGVVLEEISMCEDDNSDVVIDLLSEAYFGENPLAMTILGERDNVKNFTRQDLIDYISRNYCAESSVVSIVGNITFDKAKELVEKYFEGKFSSNCKRKWQDKRHETKPCVKSKFKDIEQSNVAIGFPAFEYDSKYSMAELLVNTIVGGGMSSRLFQEIREKRGLAYNVYTYNSSYVNNGLLSLYIGTNVESVKNAVDCTVDIIQELRKNGLTKRELERGIEQLKGSYVLGQESGGVMMRVNAKNVLFSDNIFDIDEKIKAIENITLEQTKEVIDYSYDLSKASLAYVGKKPDCDVNKLI
ncbi:MAG: insulinase family protein [Clostridia bacterium]|nr:insulinase family protein [Clostridia bacterium]MDE7328754.1 insulinase family protein [Clostridia bacterium]